jgi:hypothetical protein
VRRGLVRTERGKNSISARQDQQQVGRHFGTSLTLPAGKSPEAEEGRVRSARDPDVSIAGKGEGKSDTKAKSTDKEAKRPAHQRRTG